MRSSSERRHGRSSLNILGLLAVVALIALAMAACQVPSAQAEGKDDLFELKPSLAATKGQAEAAGDLAATLEIVVAKGYKWNAEYPFRLSIKDQNKTRLSKERFAAADLKVAKDQRSATLELGSAGTGDKGATISGTVSFSVCDKTVCKVYRNRKVEWRTSP